MHSVSKHDSAPQTESPDHARLTQRIAELPPDKLRLLARKVREAGLDGGQLQPDQKRAASCLVAIRPTGTKPPLFLLHPVGGGVQPYYLLADYLSPDQPVYAIQNHEFGSHEEHAYAPIEELAARYLDVIHPVIGDRPFYLGGWSMGGILAFEMAIQRQKRGGDAPLLLIMIDAPAQFVSVHPDDGGFAKELVLAGRIWAHQKGKEFKMPAEDLQHFEPAEQLHQFIQAVKREEIVASGADEAALRAAIKTFINNNRACERYAPSHYAGSVVVLRASEVQRETEERTRGVWQDPCFGWQAFCAKTVEVRYVPGDHMFMMFEPHVPVLGASLQEFMDNAIAGAEF